MIAVSKVFSDSTWGLSTTLHVGDDDNFSSSVSSFKGVWKVYANIMVEYFLFPLHEMSLFMEQISEFT